MTNTTEKLQHHELTVEMFTDDQGPLVCLTQRDYSGNDEHATVHLHAWQLRAVCEQFGIIASDPQAARTIATLTRRLRVLADRIDTLAAYLSNHSDHKHADLNFEMTYANATADIAAEFVVELDDRVHGCTDAPEQAIKPVKPQTGTDPRQMAIDA